MTATTCRDCHRPIADPASQAREYGPACWRRHPEVQAILATGRRRVTTTRGWEQQMPGQELLDIEGEAA